MSEVVLQPPIDERERLLEAMAQVVGKKGYRAASVEEVIAQAQSSRTEFDRQFADKRECFVAAYERCVDQSLAVVGARLDPEQPWEERMVEALRALTQLCRERPEIAKLALQETAVAGADGRRSVLRTTELFAELIDPGAERDEERPPRAALMATNAVEGLMAEELKRSDAAGLEKVLPELAFTLLLPLLGPTVAGQQMERVAARVRDS